MTLVFPRTIVLGEEILPSQSFQYGYIRHGILDNELYRLDQAYHYSKRLYQSELRLYSFNARRFYADYLQKSSFMAQRCIHLNQRLKTLDFDVTLQTLSALVQNAQLDYQRFRQSLSPVEASFESAKQIQLVMQSLETTVTYWRDSLPLRNAERGSLKARMDDDELLKLHLMKAVHLIHELEHLEKTRQKLDRDLLSDD